MDKMPLFDLPEEKDLPQSMPLAARMRPQTFADFVGQEHLVAEGRVLRKCIEADQLPSMVFWGPPGSGKTTLAHIIANVTSVLSVL
jgi:putative ATPase